MSLELSVNSDVDAVHPAPALAGQLPFEILALIFEIACSVEFVPYNGRRYTQVAFQNARTARLAILCTCSYWRQVLLASPLAWTSAYYDNMRVALPSPTDPVLHIQRSYPHPFTLHVVGCNPDPDLTAIGTAQLHRFLRNNGHSKRLTRLTGDNLAPFVLLRPGPLRPGPAFPLLHTLDLSWRGANPDYLDLRSMPALNYLSLRFVGVTENSGQATFGLAATTELRELRLSLSTDIHALYLDT
ncbi:hypothetical protein DL93DRAFT_1653345 [Clavulina sp. PMI_390]|nr:hypothetical protein DL93DRAFT_1653345 [Clavulina sp. PMI_390]